MISIAREAFDERRPVRRFVVCAWLLCVGLMAGCATVSSTSVAPARETARYFELSGRISVRIDNRLDLAQLRWSRLPDGERISFHTPFGTQVAELTKSADGLVTLRKGEEITRAGSFAELSAGMLGVALDMDEVARWLQGAGLKPDQPNTVSLSDGNTWEVTVEGLQAAGPYARATRLSATRGDVTVKLVVDEWQAR